MPRTSPQDFRSRETLLERLERVAGEINPYLVALAVGLAVLDLTCLALRAAQLPIGRACVIEVSDRVAAGPPNRALDTCRSAITYPVPASYD